MSALKVLGSDVSLTAVAAQASVETQATPFLGNRKAVAAINFVGVTGAPTIVIQTSPDDSTWTTVLAVSGVKPNVMAEITLDKHVRANVTAAGTAGTANVYLTAGA